jgi:microcystin-dependent protein
LPKDGSFAAANRLAIDPEARLATLRLPMALPPIPNNTIVSNISGQTAEPVGNTLTHLLDATLGNQIEGSIVMRVNGWTVLPPGSPGQVLQTQIYVPNWGPLSDVLDYVGNAGRAQGAVMFRGSTSWTTLAPGAAGSFLQAQGPHADPHWTVPVPTGVMMPFIGGDRNVPAGWVLAAGGTIGDAASGASTRANADTLALWQLLYSSWRDEQAPVSGGRGASATADFNAHKQIRLPDLRGRVVAGKDDMGGTAASRLTAGGSGVASTTPGGTGGEQTHTLSSGEIANHTHQVGAGTSPPRTGPTGRATWGDTVGVATFATGGVDGHFGGAHNNTQPTIVMSYIIKL